MMIQGKLKDINNISKLVNLNNINLNSNLIESVDGIQFPKELKTLNLSAIKKLKGVRELMFL